MGQIRETRLTWDREAGRFSKPATSTVVDPYLRGPIPLSWIERAARLPGQALAVGMALWHLAGLRSAQQHLSLSTERLAAFGVSRYAKDRALRNLSTAGLVAVDRKKGRSPRVSLITRSKSRRARNG
ncbi:MAG: hypothetical protein FJ279_30375 [Planctomycetes bacterium]|nr:hypothetical protein [Planctomycetota bacterium]